MARLTGILVALTLIAYVGFTGGVVDLMFGPDPEPQLLLDPRIAELIAAHQQMSYPLQCDAWVSQGMTSATMSRARCYMTKATREQQ